MTNDECNAKIEVERARGSALQASNDLAIVLSWLAPPDPDSDDDRDPATMILTHLQAAEESAVKALARIKQIRTQTQPK
jgi:hypothetical protein